MKLNLRLIKSILGASVLASMSVYAADENCNSWQSADVDSTGGRYPLELRTCELTYGLSAYVQIKNSGESRIALSYRIVTNDGKKRDEDVILEPNLITRAGNCQACAKRYSGFKSWEILTVSIATGDDAGAGTKKAVPSELGLPSFMNKQVATKPGPPEANKPAPEPVVQKKTPPVSEPAVVQPKVAEQPKPEEKTNVPAAAPVAKPEPVAEPEGIRAANGEIIPYDQLPPEFRPKR